MPHPIHILIFFLYCSGVLLDLHSFPTRRSSDLGGGSVVAQDPFDISADRGLSSFDQRHKFAGNWIYDLPFGENRRFAPKGAGNHILGGWQWSGDFTIASGLYFTPRVLGGGVDIG